MNINESEVAQVFAQVCHSENLPECGWKAIENVGSTHPLGTSWLFWDHHGLIALEWSALMFFPQCVLTRG